MKAADKCALDPGANRKPEQAAEQEGDMTKMLFSRTNWAPYLEWFGVKKKTLGARTSCNCVLSRAREWEEKLSVKTKINTLYY